MEGHIIIEIVSTSENRFLFYKKFIRTNGVELVVTEEDSIDDQIILFRLLMSWNCQNPVGRGVPLDCSALYTRTEGKIS